MEALRILGGQASLAEIYAIVQGSRRCLARFWREKVRQTLARYCERVRTGVYRLPHAA
jgi:transcriptional regulator GlxA family with amidase domain